MSLVAVKKKEKVGKIGKIDLLSSYEEIYK